MSREFATSEVIRQKCSICGSKNKMYTEFNYKGVHYGYQLTCCNCGHVDQFMDAYKSPAGIVMGAFARGKEVCIRFQDCTHSECPYYNKGSIWDAATTIDDAFKNQIDGSLNTCDNKCSNCSRKDTCAKCCADTRTVTLAGTEYVIRNSNDVQLDINACESSSNPKFH